MSTVDEIRSAMANLPPREKTLLAAELFASEAVEPDAEKLESALQLGLADVHSGRTRPIEELRSSLREWTIRS